MGMREYQVSVIADLAQAESNRVFDRRGRRCAGYHRVREAHKSSIFPQGFC